MSESEASGRRSDEEWYGPREEPSWAASERAASARAASERAASERATSERAQYAQGPPISQPAAEPWWELPLASSEPLGATPQSLAPSPEAPLRREAPEHEAPPHEAHERGREAHGRAREALGHARETHERGREAPEREVPQRREARERDGAPLQGAHSPEAPTPGREAPPRERDLASPRDAARDTASYEARERDPLSPREASATARGEADRSTAPHETQPRRAPIAREAAPWEASASVADTRGEADRAPGPSTTRDPRAPQRGDLPPATPHDHAPRREEAAAREPLAPQHGDLPSAAPREVPERGDLPPAPHRDPVARGDAPSREPLAPPAAAAAASDGGPRREAGPSHASGLPRDGEVNGLSHLSAAPPAASAGRATPRPTDDIPGARQVSGVSQAVMTPKTREEPEKDTTKDTASPSRRFVDTAAVVLILTELLIRAWAAWGGYFSLDDFTFARLAAEKGLTADLLLTPYNSHFMPGAYLMVWVETTLAPLDYRVVAAVALAGIAISYVLIWLLIRRLAGPRLAALIPLAIALFSPITLPATLWWAVSINQLAMLIAIPGALLAQLAYMRTGKARYGAIAVITAACALPFYEKAALVVPLIFVFTIILQPQTDLPDRFKAALGRFKYQWGAFVVVGAAYAAVYVTRPLDKRADSAVDLGGLLGNAATNSVPSGLLGGPWSWKAIGAVDASANPPVALRVLAVVIILAVVALTVYRRPLAWQAWALFGGTLLFDVLVLAVGRLQLGSGAAMEFRYFTDLVPIAAVALSLALLGPPAWAAEWPQRAGIEWPPVVGGTRLALANANALVLPLVAALFVSSLVSTVKYSNRWHDNPAKEYVANAQESILAMNRRVDLYDGAVPEKVAWGVLNPTNFPSRLMAPLDLPLNPDPEVSKDLYVLDPSGQLSHARVTSAKAPAGTVKNCGYRIQGKRVPIFLDKELFNWWWYAELHYTAKETTTAGFNSANTRGKKITFEKGEHTIWVKVKGPAGWITLDDVPKSAGVCVSYAAVGVADPGEPATP